MDPLLARPIALLVAALIAAVPVRLLAYGATWPSRPIHLLVPGGTGGVIDVRARWLAQRLAPALGVPIVVENRPGAGGNIGTAAGARSAPDGYTLLIVHQGTLTMNPHLYPRIGYDGIADFTPITRVGVGPLVLAVHPSVPAHSVAELVQLAQANPGALSFGSPGVGTPPHIASELFVRMAGIDAIHVPYRGGGQEVSDLVAGQITWSIEGLTLQLPQVQAGHLRALAVTGPHRLAQLPDVPTMAEAGLPGYEVNGWVGIAAPARTPDAIIARLYREIAVILRTSEARAWFESYGLAPGGEPPAAFAQMIRDENERWSRLIRDAGIKVE